MTMAYAEFNGQILQPVTGIEIDGKTVKADAIAALLRDRQDLNAVCGAILDHYGVPGLDAVLKTALSARKVSDFAPAPIGEAAKMPGTDGFTIAVFKAADVPVGTPLYAASVSQTATEGMKAALAPLVRIADAYDANNLDNEARKAWGSPERGYHENTTPPEQIELYSGRGGKRLLTLADCFKAREVSK